MRPIVAIYPPNVNSWYLVDGTAGRPESALRRIVGGDRPLRTLGWRRGSGGPPAPAVWLPESRSGEFGRQAQGRRSGVRPTPEDLEQLEDDCPEPGRTASPSRSRRPRSSGCSRCSSGPASRSSALALIAVTGFIILYRSIDIPDANAEFETQTTLVYYADDNKTQLGKFAIQDRDVISYKEMPQNIKDAVVAAENQLVLDRQRHRRQGHHPGGVQQRFGQLHRGCLDDHPAAGEDPLPQPGAVLHAQGQGGDPGAEDPAIS